MDQHARRLAVIGQQEVVTHFDRRRADDDALALELLSQRRIVHEVDEADPRDGGGIDRAIEGDALGVAPYRTGENGGDGGPGQPLRDRAHRRSADEAVLVRQNVDRGEHGAPAKLRDRNILDRSAALAGSGLLEGGQDHRRRRGRDRFTEGLVLFGI